MSELRKSHNSVSRLVRSRQPTGYLPFESLRSKDVVHIILSGNSAPGEWFIHRHLLLNESNYMRRKLEVGHEKVCIAEKHSAKRYELFFQWLYTGHYQEEEELPETTIVNNEGGDDSIPTPSKPQGLPWCVRDGVASWVLGRFLEASRFQNYAMRRLFSAYARPQLVAGVPLNLFFIVKRHFEAKQLTQFFEDLVIRNWGDTSIVNHNDEGWLKYLEDKAFRDKFVKSMGIPLEERQRIPMDITKYLVKEDQEATDKQGTKASASPSSVPGTK